MFHVKHGVGDEVLESEILQRTEFGRDEIRSKSNGLTQSERLVLLIIDGVTPYPELRLKLKTFTTSRFDRALRSLLEKNLIFEVLFPIENQQPDEIDPEVMDNYLRQEATDPLTLISTTPEDDFPVDQGVVVQVPAPVNVLPERKLPVVMPEVVKEVAPPKIILIPQNFTEVDFYLPLHEKLKAKTEQRNNKSGKATMVFPEPPPPIRKHKRKRKTQPYLWYAAIGLGLVVSIASILVHK